MSRGLMFLPILLLVVPTAMDYAFRVQYRVHDPVLANAVLVTGASTGIGRAAALKLVSLGFTVYAGVRKDADAKALTAMVEGLDGATGALRPLVLDVTDTVSIAMAAEVVRSDTGTKLIALLNNAGVSRLLPLEVIPMNTVREVMEVNYFGTLAVTQAFLPLLRKSVGRIVNIGSLGGLVSGPLTGVYSSSKFALEASNDALRRELRPWGISVSMVEPGYVKTEIANKMILRADEDTLLSSASKELYSYLFQNTEAKIANGQAKADTTTVTTDAIVHAVCDAYPKTRYFVANYDGAPAWLVARLVWLLPDRVADLGVSLLI